MNKKEKLGALLKDPISIIREGMKVKEHNYYKDRLVSDYGISQLPTIDILDLFPNLKEEINSYSFLLGTSLITDMILLKSLARRYENCSYLEIGSWRGESIANVADVTPDCTSLTLSKEEMESMNFGSGFIKVHGTFSNHIKSIKKVEKNSFTYDFSELGKDFDLIFVDGDHSYEGVLNDTKKVFSLRKNEKSVIVWHDYGSDIEHTRYMTLKAILDGIPKEKHKNLYHVSNTICAVYIEDIDLPTQYTSFPSFPNKIFSLQVTAKRLNQETKET